MTSIVGRQVESAASNLGPTITNTYPIGSEELETAIRHHATLRLEIAAVVFCALYSIAMTSQGPLKVKVTIGPARRQIGQGTGGNNAAHADSAAGRKDNLAETYQKIIATKVKLTPQKQNALRGMGFSEEDVQELVNYTDAVKHNADKIDQLVARLGLKAHVFDRTSLDDFINTTNNLPYKVNLSTDKGLERKVRSVMSELIESVMCAKKTPIEAMEKYKVDVLAHFKRKIDFYVAELASLAKKPQTDSAKQDISQYNEFLYLTLHQNGGTIDFNWNRLFANYDRVNHRFMTPTKEEMDRVRDDHLSWNAKRKLEFKEEPPHVAAPLEEDSEDESDLYLAKRRNTADLESEMDSLPVEIASINLTASHSGIPVGLMTPSDSTMLDIGEIDRIEDLERATVSSTIGMER